MSELSPLPLVPSPGRSSPKPRLKVGFILTRHFTLCAFANFIDVLRLAADEGDRSRPIMCQWSVLSDNMLPIASSSGVSVQPHEKLGDPAKFDYIAVIGGLYAGIDGIPQGIRTYLQRAAEARVPLIGICTGAFALHELGLLKGYKCCVSWFHHADFLNQFEGLDPISNQIFVVDRDRITCSGGVSSAHLAAYLVDRHVGRAQAAKSLHIMIIDDQLNSEKSQPGISLRHSTEDEVVRRALLVMQQFIEVPLSIEQVAGKIGCSKRLLERRFKTALAQTPQELYLQIRLDQACYMLTRTNKAISQIALECGFCDASHLSRTFKLRIGSSPNIFRENAAAQTSQIAPAT